MPDYPHPEHASRTPAALVMAAIIMSILLIGAGDKRPAREVALRDRKDILIHERFESPDWYKNWGMKSVPRNLTLVSDKSASRRGKTGAKILFKKGGHYGSGWQWKIDPPLEEAYFRYYVKFEKGFEFSRGGKTPGLMGWAPGEQAGWGGRRANGKNGFSTRICWGRRGTIQMYTYHADQKSIYGSGFPTSLKGERRLWKPDKWYCMEMRMKLNTPATKPGGKGKHDGIIELWRDGKLIGRKTDVRYRDLPTMKIDCLFINAYFGGMWECPKDQHIYYDNFVLATKPIGVFGEKKTDSKKTTGKFSPPPGWNK